MAKRKPQPEPDNRPAMTIRFSTEDERERFRRAAEVEGFNNLTAWLLFHARRQARETLKD